MNKPELTQPIFDAIVKPLPRRDRIIWTLGGIASRIGVGVDFVRDTLAKQPGSPIKEIGGRYYAFEEDLIAFLRFQRSDSQADDADCNGAP